MIRKSNPIHCARVAAKQSQCLPSARHLAASRRQRYKVPSLFANTRTFESIPLPIIMTKNILLKSIFHALIFVSAVVYSTAVTMVKREGAYPPFIQT
jgi:hypothetical protein